MLIRSIVALTAFSAAVQGYAANAPSATCIGKPLYDATLFEDKPAERLSRWLRPARIVYVAELWPGKLQMQKPPSRERIEAIARSVSSEIDFLVLDIEHWPITNTSQSSRHSIELLRATLQSFKQVRPDLKLGLYGLPPTQEYWRTQRDPASRAFRSWQETNTMLAALSDLLDVALPSLYTFYADPEGWEIFARRQIAEARRVLPGKPVLPFLWFEYHDSNRSLRGTDLPQATWRQEVLTACQLGDGAIIWGGWKMKWNEDATWWQSIMRISTERIPPGP